VESWLTVALVEVLPVFALTVVQVEPLSEEISILYPVIGLPPLLVGAVQVRAMLAPVAVPATLVGAPGTLVTVTEVEGSE
jgi:hypothetical protein